MLPGYIEQLRKLVGHQKIIYTSPDFDRVYPNGDESQMSISFFECEVVSGTLKLQEDEVLEIGWYDLDHLPPLMTCCAAKAHDARIFKGEAFFR